MKTYDCRNLNLPSDAEIVIAPDNHIGNADMWEPGPQKINEYSLARKNRFVIFPGDQFETIHVGDPRFDINKHTNRKSTIDAQKRTFIEFYDPIGSRIIDLMDGNHEYKLKNMSGINGETCMALDTPFAEEHFPHGLTNDAIMVYMAKFIFEDWRLLVWHGPWRGSIRSYAGTRKQRETNESEMIKRRLRDLGHDDADVMVMGHIHKLRLNQPSDHLQMITDGVTTELEQHYNRPLRIYLNKEHTKYIVPEDNRWYASTGAILKGQVEGSSGYAELAGYPPTEMGFVSIKTKNDRVRSVEKVIL